MKLPGKFFLVRSRLADTKTHHEYRSKKKNRWSHLHRPGSNNVMAGALIGGRIFRNCRRVFDNGRQHMAELIGRYTSASFPLWFVLA